MRKLSSVIQHESKELRRRSKQYSATKSQHTVGAPNVTSRSSKDIHGRPMDPADDDGQRAADPRGSKPKTGKNIPENPRESRRSGKGGVGNSNVYKENIFSFDKCAQRITCLDDITILMSVKMQVDKIKIVCIHPQNDSFPVFTKKIDMLKMNYNSHQDHDSLEG